MDSKSSLFDKIRIKPINGRKAREEADASAKCEHPECDKPGPHRAPKGRGAEGQFWRFCLQHVREYNASYNYFNGMGDDAVKSYQKDALTGHRPTWSTSANAAGRTPTVDKKARRAGKTKSETWEGHDPLGVFARASGRGPADVDVETVQRRVLTPRVRAAFDTMGLDETADPATVKARYKTLVKRFHPDANGGDRSFEARLQDIIKAYDALKTAGLAKT